MAPTAHHPHRPDTVPAGAGGKPGEQGEAVERVLRSTQIVRLAMIIALLLTGGLLGFFGLSRGAAVSPSDAFAVVVPVLSVAALVSALAVPALLRRTGRAEWESRSDDEAALASVHQRFVTMSVLQGGLLEGAGLVGAVAVLLTGNGLMLLATAASVTALAITFPRAGTIQRWVEELTGVAVEGPAEASENP